MEARKRGVDVLVDEIIVHGDVMLGNYVVHVE